jgi:signal transduction histidine kinase
MQFKAQELLTRGRFRIARDIHDGLGARLTELALEGEVIQSELPPGSSAGCKLDALCEKARAASGAMDELVWVRNSRRDTRNGLANMAERMKEAGGVCRIEFDVPLGKSLLRPHLSSADQDPALSAIRGASGTAPAQKPAL